MTSLVTVLKTVGSCIATKTITIDDNNQTNVIDYNSGKYFYVEQRKVRNILTLHRVLEDVSAQTNRFIIRGEPREDADLTHRVRRKKYIDNEVPNTCPFNDVTQKWIMIDIDGLVCPDDIDIINDPERAILYAISCLPDEFSDVTCSWQLSSTCGLKDKISLSAHIWYWLREPVSNYDLRLWAKAVNKERNYKLIDPSLYNAVQPHFTAYPLFKNGAKNPINIRSGLYQCPKYIVDIDINIINQKHIKEPSAPKQGSVIFPLEAHGFENILETLGDHEGGDGFYEPLLRATGSYVHEVGNEYARSNIEQLKHILRGRIDNAVNVKRSMERIGYYKSDEFLDGVILGAIADGYGDDADAIKPYYNSNPVGLDEAEALLENILNIYVNQVFEYWQRKDSETDDPITWVNTPPPTLAIKAAAGIGKTFQVITNCIASEGIAGNVEYYIPSHALSDELLVKLQDKLEENLNEFKDNLPFDTRINVIKGREAKDADDNTLCRKNETVKTIIKMGLSVNKTLCMNEDSKCEYYDECAYQKQFIPAPMPEPEAFDAIDFKPEVKILAHNHLFLHTREVLREPKLVVVDESFFKVGISTLYVPSIDLLNSNSDLTKMIFNTLYENAPLLEALRIEGTSPEDIRGEAKKFSNYNNNNLRPDQSQEQQTVALLELEPPSLIYGLLTRLADELERVDRSVSHSIELRKGYKPANMDKNDYVLIHSRKNLTIPEHIPMIFIDASLDEEITNLYRNNITFEHIDVERQAEVHQFTDKTFSANKLLRGDPTLLDQVKDFIENVAGNSSTLVVTTKKVRAALTGEAGVKLPKEGILGKAKIIHFGNLRGLD